MDTIFTCRHPLAVRYASNTARANDSLAGMLIQVSRATFRRVGAAHLDPPAHGRHVSRELRPEPGEQNALFGLDLKLVHVRDERRQQQGSKSV
jgi:hypothetical protein